MAARALTPERIAWPISRLSELLDNLARRAGYLARPGRLAPPPESLQQADAQAIGEWLDTAAGYLGLESEPVSALYADFEHLLQAGGPAILRLPVTVAGDRPAFVALLRGGRRQVELLCPDLRVRRATRERLQALICQPYEAPLGELIDQVLEDAGIPQERHTRARAAILRDQLGGVRIEAGWLVRLPPSAGLHSQFRHSGVYRPVWILFGMYFVQQVLSIASWFVIGRGIFQGHFDSGWLMAWAVLLLSGIPVQVIVNDAQSELSMGAGGLFKQRLIQGALKLDPEEIRHQGMGQFLNRVMESEAVEMLALSGGFTALLSFIELGLAFSVLARPAGNSLGAAGLAVWTLVTIILLWRYYQASRDWTDAYREMTNHVVEEMVGHRTRLIQEDPAHRHTDEDQELERYLKLSERMDQAGMQINAAVSRGWMLVGLSSTALAFVASRPQPQVLAIGLGGVLLASQGLSKLAAGAQSLASLANAWRQVGPLFQAAARPRHLPAPGFTPPAGGRPGSRARMEAAAGPNVAAGYAAGAPLSPTGNNGSQPVLQVRDVVFRYRPQGRPVLQDVSLQVYPGERLLLEGPSGGGKSPLGAVLTGLRAPAAGSMLLWGFDRQLLGSEAWRRRVVMAPQFQENHVFSETFAFNLLMGRRWPPEAEDLAEAEAVCRELGLGEVLERMPSGFQQMLGESGWQLSHGERSRLYIARTLLQQADLIVLDESFGALDPENLARALQCVLQRAHTVLVIAHP